MRLSYYTEGPWVAIDKAEDDETDVVEVPDEVGERMLAVQEAWFGVSAELRKIIDG